MVPQMQAAKHELYLFPTEKPEYSTDVDDKTELESHIKSDHGHVGLTLEAIYITT